MNSETIQLSSTLKTALPDAASSLEQAWRRQRQELAGWQPSGGWLLQPRTPVRRSIPAARHRA